MSGAVPPPRVGPYEVLFELAQGGMGTVHLARAVGEPVGASGFERIVALKRLHHHLSAQQDSVDRFLDEARVAARIHHANVVGVHQVGSDAAGHFLVQDYVEGDTLQGLVDRAVLKRKKLPPPVVLRIAVDALAGLSAVHEAVDPEGRPLGILHRDVSPQNLLVGRDGVTRLADFGIAKHALRSVVTDGQYLMGRVLYMPPEYLARRPIDRRFDVYGMGITLWTALAGEQPWADASDAQLVHLAVTEGVPPLSASGLTIAPAVAAIVARACARDPEARYASAQEMLAAIEELGRHTGWIASHGEVAEVVEQLAGRELAARREVLARSRGAPEGTPPATVVPRLPGARRAAVRRAVGVGVAVFVLAGASAVLWAAWRRSSGGPTAAVAAVAPPGTVVPGAAAASTATVGAAEAATGTAEPVPPATAAVTVAAAAGRAPSVSGSHRAPGARAVPSAAPVVAPSLPSAAPVATSPGPAAPPPTATDPAPPGAIKTSNPYR